MEQIKKQDNIINYSTEKENARGLFFSLLTNDMRENNFV